MKCDVVNVEEQKDGSVRINLDVDFEFITHVTSRFVSSAIRSALKDEYWHDQARLTKKADKEK